MIINIYRLNQGIHEGPDENGVDRVYQQGELITTQQTLPGAGDDPGKYKFTLVSSTTVDATKLEDVPERLVFNNEE